MDVCVPLSCKTELYGPVGPQSGVFCLISFYYGGRTLSAEGEHYHDVLNVFTFQNGNLTVSTLRAPQHDRGLGIHWTGSPLR